MNQESINAVVKDAQDLLSSLEAENPVRESDTWYTINNLRSYIEQVSQAQTRDDLLNAVHPLAHFAVDSLDFKSDLMRRVEDVMDSAHRLAYSQPRTPKP